MSDVLTDLGARTIVVALEGLDWRGGWGTNGTAAALSDTGLLAEDAGGSPAYARQIGATSHVTVVKTNDTLQVVVSITSNGTKTIREAGLFLNGVLVGRSNLSDKNVDPGEILTFTWRVRLDNG